MALSDIWDNIAGTGHWQRQIDAHGPAAVLRWATGNVTGTTVDTAELHTEKAAFVIRHIENKASVTKPLNLEIGAVHWAMAVAARQDTSFLRDTLVPFAKKFFWERELTHAVTILAPLVGKDDWDNTRAVLEAANYKMPPGEFITLADRAFSANQYEMAEKLTRYICPANPAWAFDETVTENLALLARKAAAETVSRQDDTYVNPGGFLIAVLKSGLADHIALPVLEEIRETVKNVKGNEALKKAFDACLAQRYYAETSATVTDDLPALARDLVALQARAVELVKKLDAHAERIETDFGNAEKAAEIRDTVTTHIDPFIDAVQAINNKFGYHKIGEKKEAAPAVEQEKPAATPAAAARPSPSSGTVPFVG